MSIWSVPVLIVIMFHISSRHIHGFTSNKGTGQEFATKLDFQHQKSLTNTTIPPKLNLTDIDKVPDFEDISQMARSSSSEPQNGKFTGDSATTGDSLHEESNEPQSKNHAGGNPQSKQIQPFEISKVADTNATKQTDRTNGVLESREKDLSSLASVVVNAEFPIELPNCNFTLSEIEDVCTGPSWSCQGRCGFDSFLEGASRPGTCHCSHRCLVYQSCCEDFHHECPLEFEKATAEIEKLEGMYALCNSLLLSKVINFCPIDYSSSETKLQCENADFWGSIQSSFPVTDSLSGHHFRNKACWQCWQGRSLTHGEPVTWNATVQLPDSLQPTLRHDFVTFLSRLYEDPEKRRWHAPEGYESYYCQLTPTFCTGCAGGGIEEKCINTPESFVLVDDILHKNRYCFFCSFESAVLDSAVGYMRPSAFQSDCQTPNLPTLLSPVYNMFDFTVIFSLRGSGLYLHVKEDKLVKQTYGWNALACNEDEESCDALQCANGVKPENGRCNEMLKLSVMWLFICAGASGTRAAAERSGCDGRVPSLLNNAVVAETIWPWMQNCLQAGPLTSNFQVTSVNVAEKTPPELHIQFVYDQMAVVDAGDIRLRNCALLVFTRWINTMHVADPDVDDLVRRWNVGIDASSQDRGEMAPGLNIPNGTAALESKGYTYICLLITIGAQTVDDYMEMGETDCYLVLVTGDLIDASQNTHQDNAKTRSNCSGLGKTDVLIGLCVVLLFVLGKLPDFDF